MMTKIHEISALISSIPNSNLVDIPRLQVYSISQPTQLVSLVYTPVVTLVLQGRKRTVIGNSSFEYGPGQYIIVSAEVTALGQVCHASKEQPFLALSLSLDDGIVSSLASEIIEWNISSEAADGFGTGMTTELELDCWKRIVDLLSRPEELPILQPQLERELIFRLLVGPQGKVLRGMINTDSALARIRKVMAWIRANYTISLSIDSMAEMAEMSLSVFYRKFKTVTALSPLQYQKQVRLYEARRKMLIEHESAARAAFSVGYESTSQFSREYTRLFGAPPAREIKKMREKIAVES
ncbi:AraC family transcriptional regulator N-terminal domain-containing protein [Pseudoalteromonas mariniglutinosa]|uniref:AraC family transcriptional regulator n=1 Tax=Pseudoalteromonas mariniglutinosa TaxID=206042 RepID=UPI00384C2856